MKTTPFAVEFWVKRYESRGMFKTSDIGDRERAWELYRQFVDGGDCYFVQMGARTEEGAIVLNEYRQAALATA